MITFWILWQGNNLYVMNPHTNSFKSTLAKWKTLITYTVFTMFCKVALQVGLSGRSRSSASGRSDRY